MPRTFKTKEELSKMSVKDIINYKKYLHTTIRDIHKEAKAWKAAKELLRDELTETLYALEWEAALTQIVREECDESQYDFLLNIH